jgi:hypothetical protein
MSSSYANSNIITTQPIISHIDEPKKKNINSHKNSCEKCCTCNSTADRCPINCTEFGNLFMLDREFYSNKREFNICSCICFPVTITANSLFCGPCTIYNVCRNKCANNSKSKNYLC